MASVWAVVDWTTPILSSHRPGLGPCHFSHRPEVISLYPTQWWQLRFRDRWHDMFGRWAEIVHVVLGFVLRCVVIHSAYLVLLRTRF